MSKEAITKNKWIKLIAEKCDYHLYEVEDMFEAFLEVMHERLIDGDKLRFEKICTLHIERPKMRYLYNPHTGMNYESPRYPRLVLGTSELFTEFLQSGATIQPYRDIETDGSNKRRIYKATEQHKLPHRSSDGAKAKSKQTGT